MWVGVIPVHRLNSQRIKICLVLIVITFVFSSSFSLQKYCSCYIVFITLSYQTIKYQLISITGMPIFCEYHLDIQLQSCIQKP